MSIETSLIILLGLNILLVYFSVRNINRITNSLSEQIPEPVECKRHQWVTDVRTEELACSQCGMIAGLMYEDENE